MARWVRRAVPLAALLLVATAAIVLIVNSGKGASAGGVRFGGWLVKGLDGNSEVALDFFQARKGTAPSLALTSQRHGSRSGPVSFRAADGTVHQGSRVVERHRSGAWRELVIGTDDPAGRRIVVRLEAGAQGSVRVRLQVTDSTGRLDGSVRAVSIGFESASPDRLMGLGERANAVDQRGNTVENRVVDGPYTPEQATIVKNVLPAPGFSDRADSTYFPVPWMVSTSGYGVLVANNETSRFHLAGAESSAGSRPGWSAEVDASVLDLSLFPGPTPADVLRRFSAAAGRQPATGTAAVFGPWFQPPHDAVGDASLLQRADAPASVVQTYTHYLPCGDQRKDPAAERQRIEAMHAAGYAITTYFNPMLCTSYQPVFDNGEATAAFTAKPDGSAYRYTYFTSRAFEVVQFDFSAKAGSDLFRSLLGQAVADGYDGWMEDFGEYTPDDARSADDTPGPAMHNLYPALYHRAAWELEAKSPRPLLRFARSGWTGSARFTPIVWGGDPTSNWGFDGLRSAVTSALNMGLTGVSTWGSDIGGFFTSPKDVLTPELLKRWIEFGAVSGVMRTQTDGTSLGGPPRPQITDPDVLPTWRYYAKLRTQLYPYIAGAFEQYQRSGLPLMRHLALVAPDDRVALGVDDEFGFGPDMLAAPVLEPGATSRRVYLPAGHWVDLGASTSLQPDGALVLGAAVTEEGGRWATVPAPVDRLPLMVRAGAVLALLPADVDTLSDYGEAPGLVHLRDRGDVRRLLAFPAGSWSGALGPGETMSARTGPGYWELDLHGVRSRHYDMQASLGAMPAGWTPCKVSAGGHSVPFQFDRTARLLSTAFELSAGTVRIEACSR